VRRWLPGGAGGEATASTSASAPDPVPRIPSLSGIDVTGTLQRLGLEFETLRRMLVRFADGHAPTLDALRAGVASGDAPEAARHAHAIAGAAGNLGVDALRNATKALEHAARAGRTDLAPLLAEVEQCTIVALRSIDTLRDVTAVVPAVRTVALDTKGVRTALERLQVALGDFELSAMTDALAELTALGVPVAAEADLIRLRDRVQGYDYDEAQNILARIVTELERTGPS
jgi:two-component system, sensor histidine kinase and response regulator